MSGIFFALLNAVAIAALGLVQKKALLKEHSLEFATLSTLARTILFFGLFGWQITWVVSSGILGGLLLTSMISGLGFFFLTKALRRQDLSVVLPIVNLDAAVAALLALLILGETLAVHHFLGLALLILGTYALHVAEHPKASFTLKHFVNPFRALWQEPGGHYAFLGMIFLAISAVLDRFLLRDISWQTYLGYTLPFTSAFFLLLSALHRHTFDVWRKNWRQLWWGIGLAAIFFLTANIAYAIALSLTSVAFVVAIKRSASVIDVLASGKIFHEQAVWQKSLATIIMLLGIVFILLP